MILNTALGSVFVYGALSNTTPETQIQYEKHLKFIYLFIFAISSYDIFTGMFPSICFWKQNWSDMI